jgi:hypothetical protein
MVISDFRHYHSSGDDKTTAKKLESYRQESARDQGGNCYSSRVDGDPRKENVAVKMDDFRDTN